MVSFETPGVTAGGSSGGGREVEHAVPYFVGVSLKMYMGHHQTLDWCERVTELARRHPAVVNGDVDLVVLPSFPALAAANDLFRDTRVQLGAQDLHWQDHGAFTGEVGGPYLAEVGCGFAEVGHAERRTLFREDGATVAAKTAAAWRNGLVPLLCVGELERVSAELGAEFCIAQLRDVLGPDSVPPAGPVVVAYEPQWAIGAAEPASAEDIRAVCTLIGQWLTARVQGGYSRVIYGGSAGPGLLTELDTTVDGLFLGRFAHDWRGLEKVLDEVDALCRQQRAIAAETPNQ